MARSSGNIRIKIEVSGVNKVQRKLGVVAAELLHAAIEIDVKQGVRDMTIQAYKNAPIETGALRTSILGSIHREGDMEYIFGSYMPYAQRQEYEHKTKKMYLHRAVWSERPRLQRAIVNSIKRRLK